MTNETLDRPLRVFWGRQTSKGLLTDHAVPIRLGHLPAFLAERVSLPFDAPVLWDTLKLVCAFVAANPPYQTVDVHFPLLDRRQSRDPQHWMNDLSVVPVAPGVAFVWSGAAEQRRGYAESVLTLAASGSPAPDLCLASGREQVSDQEANALLSAYGLQPIAGTGEQLLLDLRLPGEALNVWFDAPKPATNAFYLTFTGISMRLQKMLRAWLRYKWPSDLWRWRDLVASRGSMMYWLSAPKKSRTHTDFTRDVLSPDCLRRLCRIGSERFGAELEFFEDKIRHRGDLLAAHAYRRIHTREIMDAVRRERKTVTNYLACEAAVIEALITYAAGAVKNGRGDCVELATGLMNRLRNAFRKWPMAHCADWMATLTLMEATSSLCHSLGRPAPIRLSVTPIGTAESSAAELPLAC